MVILITAEPKELSNVVIWKKRKDKEMRYAVDVIVTIHLEADSVHEAVMMAVDEVIADGYDCEFSECREEENYEWEDDEE